MTWTDKQWEKHTWRLFQKLSDHFGIFSDLKKSDWHNYCEESEKQINKVV